MLLLNILFEYSNDLKGKELQLKLSSTVVRKYRACAGDNFKDPVIYFQKDSCYELSSNNARYFISEIRIKIHLNKYPSWCLLLHIISINDRQKGLFRDPIKINWCNKPLSFSSFWSSLIIQDGPIRSEIEREFCVTIFSFDMFVFLFSHYIIHGTNPAKDEFIFNCEEY